MRERHKGSMGLPLVGRVAGCILGCPCTRREESESATACYSCGLCRFLCESVLTCFSQSLDSRDRGSRHSCVQHTTVRLFYEGTSYREHSAAAAAVDSLFSPFHSDTELPAALSFYSPRVSLLSLSPFLSLVQLVSSMN